MRCYIPAVKNGYVDFCQDDDFFDLTYADLGEPKLNFILVVENIKKSPLGDLGANAVLSQLKLNIVFLSKIFDTFVTIEIMPLCIPILSE